MILFTTAVVAVTGAMFSLAAAQDDATPGPPVQISEVDSDSPLGSIIPGPNSGRSPDEPGDRGGSLQLALLALILAFFAIAVFSIRRQMRKAQQPAASAPGPASGPGPRPG